MYKKKKKNIKIGRHFIDVVFSIHNIMLNNFYEIEINVYNYKLKLYMCINIKFKEFWEKELSV